MKRLKFLLLAVSLALLLSEAALGADVSTHVMTFDFQAINEIEITGTPSLTIASATAGEQPQEVTDSSSTCAITTNGTNKRITANIDIATPAYVTLKVNVAAPSGSGTSQGDVTLTTSASDVVTGMSHVADSSPTITYKLSATVQAGVLSTDTRTVTFTLSD
jgi:spore germination protein YaaH